MVVVHDKQHIMVLTHCGHQRVIKRVINHIIRWHIDQSMLLTDLGDVRVL